MKYSKIIIPAMLCLISAIAGAKTPGMTAYREQNYGAAARLLVQELSHLTPGTDEYFDHETVCIESMLFCGRIAEAVKKIEALRPTMPAKYKDKFLLLNAQAAYVQQNFKLCRKLLDDLSENKNLSASMRYNIVLLQAELLLRSNEAAEAVSIMEKSLADSALAAEGEFILSMTFMRALAADNKLNRIPSEFARLKKKYPDRQGKLQHFELLVHAINQDLKKYDELFRKIFPSEHPLYAFIGDVVLYQGSLLAEQQAQKEQNVDEIAFHLKNQTFFAPNDDLRIESWKNLIQLYLRNKKTAEALTQVRSMLKKIPRLQDRIKWELICADLQSELKDGDLGLKIYLSVKNNSKIAYDLRAEAAEKAAEIYRQQGQKSEMLKLYTFLAEFAGQPHINDRGILLTGKFYFENKQYRMGESMLLKLADTSREYPEALLYLIQCRIANGEYDFAAVDIQKLASLKDDEKNNSIPEFALAADYFKAVLLEIAGKAEEAAVVYEKTARRGSQKTASQGMLINSWLKAAELQFKRRSYSNAGLLFLSFAEHYPKHESAPAALYKSVYSYFLAGRYDEMKYSIGKLQKEHPEHNLTVSSLFHEVDYLHNNDRMQEALKILEIIENINKKIPKNTVAAQIIYDRALILYHLQNDADALLLLTELQKYSDLPIASEGMFLAATIMQEQGNNQAAAEHFRSASKMRSDLLFVQICLGRCADNLFLAGTKAKNDDLLKQAARIYSEQINNKSLDKVFRLQSLYKWGRTLENLKDWQGALDAYTEALYLFDPDKEALNGNIIPIWINKSAVNAVNINLRQGGSNALRDSIFIVRRLKKLNTMPAAELETLEYNIRNRYINND